jgi:hypothetical protein
VDAGDIWPSGSQVTDLPANPVVGNPTDDGVNGPVRTSFETRPINMSVIWAMRSLLTGGAPIGSIVAWHADLPGTSPLPTEWVRCDGQVLVDTNSPYDGQTIPDLNGRDRYLRGAPFTSGDLQDDAFQGHWHNASHNAEILNVGSSYGQTSGARDTVITISVLDPTTDLVNGDPRTGSETRPINMSVVWVMKVRSPPVVPLLGPGAALWLVVALIVSAAARVGLPMPGTARPVRPNRARAGFNRVRSR